MNLAERVTALLPTAVKRVMQEAKQLQAAGQTLMCGQPDTPTPLYIVEALRTLCAMDSPASG